jgi:hypothetical protein
MLHPNGCKYALSANHPRARTEGSSMRGNEIVCVSTKTRWRVNSVLEHRSCEAGVHDHTSKFMRNRKVCQHTNEIAIASNMSTVA